MKDDARKARWIPDGVEHVEVYDLEAHEMRRRCSGCKSERVSSALNAARLCAPCARRVFQLAIVERAARALAKRCDDCGSRAGDACRDRRGREMKEPHAVRLRG